MADAKAKAKAKASFWDMDDSLGSYLGEIASPKPLSSAQEVESNKGTKMPETNLSRPIFASSSAWGRNIRIAAFLLLT
jgi:hypothetical protein